MSAPIALFAYSRPNHVRRTVESLLTNPEAADSDLIIFSDGARSPDDEATVQRVRDYVDCIVGFRSLTVHMRPYNYGLADSIIDGVSRVLQLFKNVIVLEDDLLVSAFFLQYMNEALDRYADDSRVISVHGYVYPIKKSLPKAFFLRGADCLGWATWRRGWSYFNPDGQFLYDSLKNENLLRDFDFNGSYDFSAMLHGQINGKNNSWAVRWYASAFIANKLTLYPGRSLVQHAGNDGSGTNFGISSALDVEFSKHPIILDDLLVEESDVAKNAFEHYFRASGPLPQRILGTLMSADLRQRAIFLAKDWLPPVLIRQFRRLLSPALDITF